MTRTLYIPKGMGTLDQLARKRAGMRHYQEIGELYCLHSDMMEHCGAAELPNVDTKLHRALKQISEGSVSIPPLRKRVHLQSSLWGSIELPRHFEPSRYVGNVGYLECARDLSIRLFTIVSQYRTPLPEVKGGSKYFTADWRKSLYLLQLSQSERYLRQFEGLAGFDAYAKRYFFGNRGAARSFAINHFPSDVFETLGWHTGETPGVLIVRGQRQVERTQALEEIILACMRDVHAKSPRCNFRGFTEKLLRRRKEWSPLPEALDWSDPIRKFAKEYRSWIALGIDMEEIDRILEMHGPGYRGMEEIYDEFVSLAEEELMSAEELSRIAVERGLMRKPLRVGITQKQRDPLLDIFRDYPPPISIGRLDDLLKKNAFWQAVRRIVLWNYLPADDRPDLVRFLGAQWGRLSREHVNKWLSKNFRDPENTGPMYDHARVVYGRYSAKAIEAYEARMRLARKSGAHRIPIVIKAGGATMESEELVPVSAQAIARLDALEELADDYQDDLSESWFDSFVGDIEKMRARIEKGLRPDERAIANFVGRLKRALGEAFGDPDRATKLIEAALD